MDSIYSTQKSTSARPRLYYIDNLRIALISLVVAHHAAQPYGPTGGDWPIFNPERSALLAPFYPVNAAFFMGLFFLISGYFVPRAFDRKGATIFLKDRLLRLGIPLLFIGIVVFSPLVYVFEYAAEGGDISFWSYFFRIYLGEWQIEFGHMWFVAQLLLFALIYALWRLIVRRETAADQSEKRGPSHWSILGYTLILAIATYIIRIRYPIDHWVRILWLVPAEVAHLPQYLSLFFLGTVAYRRDWLHRLSIRTGMTWLWIGLAAAVLVYAYDYGLWRLLPVGIIATGGSSWQSLVWSTWEAFICTGLCVGLLVLFREQLNRQGNLVRKMSAAAYTVYIIHFFLLVTLQFTIADAGLPPFLKFVIVTLLGIPLCFAVSHFIIKLPLARRIL
ncbi:MAG: acyltransferase family protein [Fidelibacterota bacterium]|nr:MAG: acyltransferase family protein [Candidatus Neomarinimicrobiota bacterium]